MYNNTKKLIECLSVGLYEKQHHIAMALLSAVAGESIFLLGPPGTAKSMISRRLKMAFKDATAFEYLMSRFSTPDEIFGPVSIARLKNDDVYERKVEGYLPSATIVFLDEIWKAGPAIQNALLTAINERIYQNGSHRIELPMKALIAASNELPAEGEGLEALWDRFLVRLVSNGISSDKNFANMVRQKSHVKVDVPPQLLLTDEKLALWQTQIEEIEIGDDILKFVLCIRKILAKESKQKEIEPLDYYVSDRRWKKVFHLMQTSAFLNGRKAVNLSDGSILFHCLWNKDTTIPTIINAICTAYTSEIDTNIGNVHKMIDRYIGITEGQKNQDLFSMQQVNRSSFKLVDYLYFSVMNHPLKSVLIDCGSYMKLPALDTRGFIYYDKYRKAYIIHPIEGRGTVNLKTPIRKIRISRTVDGISIDGVEYPFEIDNTNEKDESQKQNIVLLKDIRNAHAEAIRLIDKTFADIVSAENLFLSPDDDKLIRKILKEAKLKAEELEVKIRNLNSQL